MGDVFTQCRIRYLLQESFELNHETLYLAVKLVDLYLSRVPSVRRDKLQLIGATAMFVAAKFDVSFTNISHFLSNICNLNSNLHVPFFSLRNGVRQLLTIFATFVMMRIHKEMFYTWK